MCYHGRSNLVCRKEYSQEDKYTKRKALVDWYMCMCMYVNSALLDLVLSGSTPLTHRDTTHSHTTQHAASSSQLRKGQLSYIATRATTAQNQPRPIHTTADHDEPTVPPVP
jgi:hypothetical protein